MTYNPDSWRDDFEPNVHPTIAHALHAMRGAHAASLANHKATPAPAPSPPQRWPFPTAPTPPDRRNPPPRHADAEEAPL